MQPPRATRLSRRTLATSLTAAALAVAAAAFVLSRGSEAAPAQAALSVASKGFSVHGQGCGDARLRQFYLRGNGSFVFWAPQALGGHAAAQHVTLRDRVSGKPIDRTPDHAVVAHATLRGGSYALDVHADGCWRLDVQGDLRTRAGGPPLS